MNDNFFIKSEEFEVSFKLILRKSLYLFLKLYFKQDYSNQEEDSSRSGAFGEVKILYRKKYKTNVAIKTLKPDEDHDENEAIRKEIDFLSSMKHANIVEFFGWTLWRDKKAIVMEFMHTSLQSGKMFFIIFLQ